MSRDPYAPSPSYRMCSYCNSEYDNSGYYGTDDESHFCKQKLIENLKFMAARFPDIQAHLANAIASNNAAAVQRKQQLHDEEVTRLKRAHEEHRSAATAAELRLAKMANS